MCFTPAGTSPFQPRCREQIVGGLSSGCAFARRILRVRHPQIDNLEQVEAAPHVGVAEHLRFGEVKPTHRVKRIRVWCRYDANVGRGVFWNVDELPHRRFVRIDLRHIAHLDTRDLGRDQRIAINIGVGRDLLRFRWRERLGFCWQCNGHARRSGDTSAQSA